MGFLFPEQGYGSMDAFQNFLSPSNLITLLVIVLICQNLWYSPKMRAYQERSAAAQKYRMGIKYLWPVTGGIVLAVILTVTIGYYFINRINYMFQVHGLDISDTVNHDFLHLQIQFLWGLSLSPSWFSLF